MRVFLSWSGERSQRGANAINDWIRAELPGVEPWVSADMEKGVSWSSTLLDSLTRSTVGLLCVTSEAEGDWMAFEAGALLVGSGLGESVRIVLLDPDPAALAASPLAQFGSISADEAGLRELHRMLGGTGEPSPERLSRLIDKLRAIGTAKVRSFELVFVLPEGAVRRPRPYSPVQDMEWLPVIAEIADALRRDGTPIGEHDFSTFHHLDLTNAAWLPTPRWISAIVTDRLALVHPHHFDAWYGDAKLAAEELNHNFRLNAWLEARDRRERFRASSAFLYGLYLLELADRGMRQPHIAKLLDAIHNLPGVPQSWRFEIPARFIARADLADAEKRLGRAPPEIMRLVLFGMSYYSIREGIERLGGEFSFEMLERVLDQFRKELKEIASPVEVSQPIVEVVERMGRRESASQLPRDWEALGEAMLPFIKWLDNAKGELAM
jgi:hypothetical protein